MIPTCKVYVDNLPKSCGSSSESDLSLDIFVSTIFPRSARAACDLAGKKSKLSTPCVPVGDWRSCRYGMMVNWG